MSSPLLGRHCFHPLHPSVTSSMLLCLPLFLVDIVFILSIHLLLVVCYYVFPSLLGRHCFHPLHPSVTSSMLLCLLLLGRHCFHPLHPSVTSSMLLCLPLFLVDIVFILSIHLLLVVCYYVFPSSW